MIRQVVYLSTARNPGSDSYLTAILDTARAKNGDKGKTKITFDASWTFSSLAEKADLLNAEQYKQFYTEGLGDAFTTLYDSYHISGTDTDWQEAAFWRVLPRILRHPARRGNTLGRSCPALASLDRKAISASGCFSA